MCVINIPLGFRDIQLLIDPDGGNWVSTSVVAAPAQDTERHVDIFPDLSSGTLA